MHLSRSVVGGDSPLVCVSPIFRDYIIRTSKEDYYEKVHNGDVNSLVPIGQRNRIDAGQKAKLENLYAKVMSEPKAGGTGFNVTSASALVYKAVGSKLRPELLGSVGDDGLVPPTTQIISGLCAKRGVVGKLFVDKENPTGTILSFVTPTKHANLSNRTMLCFPGSSHYPFHQELKADDFARSGIGYCTAYEFEVPGLIQETSRLVREQGGLFCLNMGSAYTVAQNGVEIWRMIKANEIDIIIANDEEAGALLATCPDKKEEGTVAELLKKYESRNATKDKIAKEACGFLSTYLKLVAVTMAEKGSYISISSWGLEEPVHDEAIAIPHGVEPEPTCCGDGWVGSLFAAMKLLGLMDYIDEKPNAEEFATRLEALHLSAKVAHTVANNILQVDGFELTTGLYNRTKEDVAALLNGHIQV